MRKTLILLFITLSQFALAQTDSTSTGEVVDAEIVIEKEQRIVLPVAEKIYSPIEVINYELEPLDLNWEIIRPDFNWPAYKSNVNFIRTNKEFPTAKYQSYIKAGYGNFASPLLEAGLFGKLDKVKLSSGFFHESFGSGPVGDENSASSITLADVSAGFEGKSFMLTPSLSYSRYGYRFFGNTDRITSGINDGPVDKAASSNVRFGVRFSGAKKDFTYFITPNVYSTNQKFTSGQEINSESGFEIDAGLSFKLDKKFIGGLDIETWSGKYEGGTSYSRSLYVVKPWVDHTSESFNLKAGFNLVSEQPLGSDSRAGFYPFAKGEFKLLPKWWVYGSFDSGIEWNSLNMLLETNQFLDDSLFIQNSELTSAFGGGIKGSPVNSLNLDAGVSLKTYEGMPFYVPSPTDSSRYTLDYDGKTTIFSFYGKVALSLNAGTMVGADFELLGYTVRNLDKAWHLPTHNLSVYFSRNIRNKLLLETRIVSQGGIKSPVNFGTGEVTLSSFVDMNVSADYNITERASVFLKLNNLFNKEYERYLGYPVRGLTFKVGAGYRF